MLEYDSLRAARRHASKVEVYIACPVCGPTRSTAAKRRRKTLLTRDKGEGLIGYHCYHCSLDGYVLEGGRTRQSRNSLEGVAATKRAADAEEIERKERLDYVSRIWNEAIPIAGTPGEAWLAGRGIEIRSVPDHAGLRFHLKCPATYEGAWRRPCVLARYVDASTGEAKGIRHRTIEPGPHKAMTLGPMHGCVIRLWPSDGDHLCLAEGVETALYAGTKCMVNGRLLRPIWAAGCDSNMAAFPVLPDVKTLTLVADNDPKGAGQRAAAACADRWVAGDRDVQIITPARVKDMNDLHHA
jgi:hypothetical protein